MTPRRIFALRYAATCADCGADLPAGTQAFYSAGVARCLAHVTTRLPDAVAEGAVDSTKKPMMTMSMAKAIAMGSSGNPAPGKRRRLPMHIRRAQQQRRNNS